MAGGKGGSPAPGYAGSRASTEQYSYGPKGSAERVRKSRNFVDCGSPLPPKTISVLHRPYKPSMKNSENLDVQHEKDTAAFERRANSYRRLAHNGYHHNAPPGSILTTFEKGHIVDRGRGRSDVHEARGVYDPVNHSYRIPPSAPAPAAAGASRDQRPTSAPHMRGAGGGSYAAIHAAQQQQVVQQAHHDRATTPFEHKLLQASRGTYNPLTHEYKDAPEVDYVQRKQKEFQRLYGLGQGIKRVQPTQTCDPITGEPLAHSPAPATAPPAPAAVEVTTPGGGLATSAVAAATGGGHFGGTPTTPGAAAIAAQKQRPTSAPRMGGSSMRKSMAGPSWGTYNPLTHEWSVKPSDPKFEQQEKLVERQLGVSGQSAGRASTPSRHGVYNPITNNWTVLPADPRVAEGLTFKPATLFSRPTAATIRM
ncbi:hypothetical protein CHLRE_07g321250v5 [Chlamydomonas reinhardtii]|uniref:Uncharacterized protein n=1 Tax=Chlamydomonas reinhardtii TaxID=3055 RepID=A0A2K3DJ26_CHLRE|nr:uncharacterized protein CHLRE_07g321250v5 [Chlamydomonas reinhardtii]PNW80531.1 hypothetical protein CHLRE_07g321250v5 [Chlamydomonas reinhardtii]